MRFAALRHKWYPGYLVGGTLAMGGDLFEHAVTYYVMWQLFESPWLAGFAAISHWAPHLFFGVLTGAIADRFDCRKVVQLAQVMFMAVSVGWAITIATNTLQPWMCVGFLIVHGFASALWHPAEQLLIYDIVGPKDIASGVRLLATCLQLGMMIGPAIGAALLFSIGPVAALYCNLLLYLPLTVLLFLLPYDGHAAQQGPRARLGLGQIGVVLREVGGFPRIALAMLLQAAVGMFIGTTLLPLFPEFGELLGVDENGLGYSLMIIAMAAGAVVGGVVLEAVGRLRPSIALASAATMAFAAGVLVFALSRNVVLSVAALFVAGIFQLVSATSSQTLVQLDAPDDRRGRFLGAYSMASMGGRAGSGLIIGFLASLLGVPIAVAISSGCLLVCAIIAAAAWGRIKHRVAETAAPEPAETA